MNVSLFGPKLSQCFPSYLLLPLALLQMRDVGVVAQIPGVKPEGF